MLLIIVLLVVKTIGHEAAPTSNREVVSPRFIPTTPPGVFVSDALDASVVQAGDLLYDARLVEGEPPIDPPALPIAIQQPLKMQTAMARIVFMTDNPPDTVSVGFFLAGEDTPHHWTSCHPNPDETAWYLEQQVSAERCLMNRADDAQSWSLELSIPDDQPAWIVVAGAIWKPQPAPDLFGEPLGSSYAAAWTFTVEHTAPIAG